MLLNEQHFCYHCQSPQILPYISHYYFWRGNKLPVRLSSHLNQTRNKLNYTSCCNSVTAYHSWFHRFDISVNIFRIHCQRDDLLWTFAADANDSTANQFADMEQLIQGGHTLQHQQTPSSWTDAVRHQNTHNALTNISNMQTISRILLLSLFIWQIFASWLVK